MCKQTTKRGNDTLQISQQLLVPTLTPLTRSKVGVEFWRERAPPSAAVWQVLSHSKLDGSYKEHRVLPPIR